MDSSMMVYVIAGLAFLAIAGIGLAFTGNDNDGAKKRAKAIGQGAKVSGKGRSVKVMDEAAQRRKKNQAMLQGLREQNGAKRKRVHGNDIKTKLEQSGLNATPAMFWIASLVIGLLLATLVYLSGADGLTIKGMEFKNRYIVVAAALFAGIFGVPRFLLGMMITRRHKKMTNQFADAIDIIVRGVKSGLPLNECLRIIARESPQPLGGEFVTLADSIAMGTTIERALQSFYKRVPLPEVNFFVIVLTIQSKSGGNLSEALGNLSIVIRSRKMMREKIKALSSEAKASAMIIGCLPFAVAFMVYLTTPDYIMELFRKETGHLILAMATALMGTGIMVMRKMINFDI